jgi:hypothetical protein
MINEWGSNNRMPDWSLIAWPKFSQTVKVLLSRLTHE